MWYNYEENKGKMDTNVGVKGKFWGLQAPGLQDPGNSSLNLYSTILGA